ncbi:MAG: DUF190 domain-containing protein [Pseudomonadota bacterium]|nr:DUF190 domain-containing protein [Pseudomonadota bacterium]
MSKPMKMARAYFTEGDKLLIIIMDYLHNIAQVKGVTVLRGYSGFGRSGVVHSQESPQETSNLPLCVEFFDEIEKIDGVIAHFKDMFEPGHIVSWKVNAD